LNAFKSLHSWSHYLVSKLAIIKMWSHHFFFRLLRVLETGVYRKQRSYWVHMKLHCVAQNFVITVGMEYVAPLLLMLICADILVVIILLVELAWKRFLTRPIYLT